MKRCSLCNQDKELDEFHKDSKGKDGRKYVCKECRILQDRALKETVFAHYGGCCICCGETEISFLALDHINSDGAQQRKTARRTGIRLYAYLYKYGYRDDLQLLCHNCNLGRHINNGICPHITARSNS